MIEDAGDLVTHDFDISDLVIQGMESARQGFVDGAQSCEGLLKHLCCAFSLAL